MGIYQDETFYLTGTDRLQNGVQLEQNVVLLDADMTPLSVLPMDLPTQTQMDDIISNHTSPTMKRIGETVALHSSIATQLKQERKSTSNSCISLTCRSTFQRHATSRHN